MIMQSDLRLNLNRIEFLKTDLSETDIITISGINLPKTEQLDLSKRRRSMPKKKPQRPQSSYIENEERQLRTTLCREVEKYLHKRNAKIQRSYIVTNHMHLSTSEDCSWAAPLGGQI